MRNLVVALIIGWAIPNVIIALFILGPYIREFCVRVARRINQLFCSHEIALSDYLTTIDERGFQHKVDYCAICGQVRPSQEDLENG